MKNYAVFAWQDFEAKGGWKDLVKLHDSHTSAERHAVNLVEIETPGQFYTEAQVVDLEALKVVAEFRRKEKITGSPNPVNDWVPGAAVGPLLSK